MRIFQILCGLALTSLLLSGRPSGGVLTIVSPDPSFDPFLNLDYSGSYRIERYAGRPWASHLDGEGTWAEICSYVGGIASDGQGGFLFSQNQSNTIRHLDSSGRVTTFVGKPFARGHIAGKGVNARLSNPVGLVRSSKGDYFFADGLNSTIEHLTADGTVSTYANVGVPPHALAIDAADNLYFVSSETNCIYMLTNGDPTRSPRLLAGTENKRGYADGMGRFALFEGPNAIAVSPDGVVYVSDNWSSRIRTLSPDGMVRTLLPSLPEAVDGVIRSRSFYGASAMVWHPDGFLVVASNTNVAKISPSGEVSNIAGRQDSYQKGLPLRDGQGAYASFVSGEAITVDTDGSLVLADHNTIRRVTLAGTVTTLAGADYWGGMNGFAEFARFWLLLSACCDEAGQVYLTGGSAGLIHRIGADMMVQEIPITVGALAGYDAIIYRSQDSSLYLGSSQGDVIRIAPDGMQEVICSVPGMTCCVGLAFGPKGELYISDAYQHVVWRWTREKGLVIAAGSWQQPGSADGTSASGRLHYPEGIAVDKAGNLYIADSGNHTLRKMTSDGVLSTLAGSAGRAGRQDGIGATALFNEPQTLALDEEGNLLVTDTQNTLVRRITPTGRVSTLAGQYLQQAMIPGFVRDGASLGGCRGLASSPDGYVFVVSDSCVMRLSPTNCVLPKRQESKGTEGAAFSVVPASATARLQWYHGDQAIPGATGTELFMPTLVKANEGLYSVSIDGVRSAAAELLVRPAPVITVAPVAPATVPRAGAALSLSVQAAGDGLRYQWRKDGVALAGATSARLTVDRLHLADAGRYDVVVSNDFGSVVSAAIPVSVTPLTSMSNLSTRSTVLGGDSVQIVGFAISGTAEKTLLIRAAGPGLGLFGLSDYLKDPQLDLYDSGGRILASNNDWSADASAALRIVQSASELGAFAFTQGSKDAALLVTLKPGLYTALVKGADQGSGINLIEVYGTGEVTDSQLSNLSTRSMVQTESSVQIGGFVISGPSSKRVLLRASGPSLASLFGVSGTLADPVLDLYDESNTPVTSNDNWSSDATDADALSAAANRLGAFAWPKGSLDAGILVTLKPGRYTAIVHGKGTATGIALLELYDAD